MKKNRRDLELLLDRYVKNRDERWYITDLIYNEYLSIGERIKLDPIRNIRAGTPELVYAEYKSIDDIETILSRKELRQEGIIFTRLTEHQLKYFKSSKLDVDLYPEARVMVSGVKAKEKYGPIGILAAGTSDIPVAEEARIISEHLGIRTIHSYDVGVANLFRLFDAMESMSDAKLFIVTAGMEGALPTVVSSLSAQPVIGVPTSVGYGYNAGMSALSTMLQSCTAIMVVNVDGGAIASMSALKILKAFQDEGVYMGEQTESKKKREQRC